MADSSADFTISAPEADQQRVLQEWLDDAAQQGIDVGDVMSISRAFDGYVEQTVQTKAAERGDPTTFCTMIGFAMGEHLRQRSSLEWRVVTDSQGTDLALTTPDESAVLFPSDPVAAAWEVAEVGWIPQWVENLLVGLTDSPA
ncbi:DUF3806 domain-containing protein [Demetria terragena]|uniref:DUF3806 domain-containing protein n=1 Tax=Demetria terragena TaxID=63959 RepID=UPI00036F1BAD|nr:DUF3806 domain-containing protein [Demetria terragena]